jgi:signal transduction histidine kinase
VPLTHPRNQSGSSMGDVSGDEVCGETAVHDGSAAARRIAELEHEVRALQLRVQTSEAEREQLALACREAREAQQTALAAMRAGEEILSTVTHDLRNPLNTIVMGASALLQTDGSADPRFARIRNLAERVHRQAERMTHQIANLGDFSAIQAGRVVIQRSPQLPSTIIAAAAELAGPIVRERGVEFEAHMPTELAAIDCDGSRIVQVLANLVNTAVKVTPRNGTIEISARPDKSRVVFFVRDTGPGIPRDELATLFGPLWRSSQSSYKGAGLGFAIARGIVEAHGGEIWADSEIGAGTTVRFALPTVITSHTD